MNGDKGKLRIRKNDQVTIVSGKSIGNSGRVLKVDRKKETVIVEGQNMVKKAMRQRKQNQKGGIVEIEAPVHISNVMINCKKCGKTKIGVKMVDDKKVRVCRKCGEEL
ncbi:MAG: 50S ribosomal protein L24 [Spirochaetales bacterium]|nr:50S ribosomal protein L24 [Spirochaetales bacterium]